MNAAQANAIALPAILNKLGYQPQKRQRRDHLYFSPLREEKTPSFHVHISDNVWYDFGEGRGGDVVDFACAYLESRNFGYSVQEALHFLSEMQGLSLPRHVFRAKVAAKAEREEDCPALSIVDTRPLRHPGLLHYLTNDRMIPLDLARKYLHEVEIHNRNSGKTFHAIGMQNADGGYELRRKFLHNDFKGCVGHKDVTVLRGAVLPAPEVHVFEGFMDLLSALADQELEAFPGDMIVLHSLACLSKALPYIEDYEHYKRLFSWLDNDQAGEKATQFLKGVAQRQGHLDFCEMNSTYAPFKDVNECRMVRLKLPLLR